MNTQTMTLDISKRGETAPVLVLRQGDRNGTNLDVLITDNGAEMALAGYTVRLCVKLPDGIHYYSVDGTVDGSTASFAIDETYAGAYLGTTDEAYVEVLYGSEIICSTHRFTVVVEPSAREGAEPGEQHIAEIDAVIAAVEALIDEIQEGAVFGVKGNEETEYRTGSVNLTPANIGAALAIHSHAISDVTGLTDALNAKLDSLDVSVSQTATGADITVNGTTVSIANGTDGSDGSDGTTPLVDVTAITGGHNVAFSYGLEDPRNIDFDVMDGVDGQDGRNGVDGQDGADGQDGQDGITPEVEVTAVDGGHHVAFDYGTGDPRNTDFYVMDGDAPFTWGTVGEMTWAEAGEYTWGKLRGLTRLLPPTGGTMKGDLGLVGTLTVNGDVKTSGDVKDLNGNAKYLPLTGGTIAGNLIVNGAVTTRDSTIDRDGANPSSVQFGQRMLRYDDKDGEIIGYLQPKRMTDGRIGIQFTAVNENNGANAYGSISVYVATNGAVTYEVTSPANFRSAISAAASSHTHAPKTTTHSASSTTIAAGANYYANFGGVAAISGYVPVAAVMNMTGMSNYANLVTGSLQTNGTYIWVRIYNSGSSSCTGSWSATVYWLPAP